jgi:2-dehydro-3-deoxygalactonokinase
LEEQRHVADRFVALDWGTTNRRAWLVADGAVLRETRDGEGVASVDPGGFPSAAARAAAALGAEGVPMLCAGMAGSNRGWADAGYVPAPATLADLAAAAIRPAEGVAILPGVSMVDGARGDVMRGEEVQLLGAAAAGLVPDDALLCQPGTHAKWARVSGGAILDFRTAMTGELFALLRAHALIGHTMREGQAEAGTAFEEGVDASADGDLVVQLFGVRPASLLGLRPEADAASYVSGLLIGADCRARVRPGDAVWLVAEPGLGDLYAAALARLRAEARIVSSRDAFLAGITRLRELMA